MLKAEMAATKGIHEGRLEQGTAEKEFLEQLEHSKGKICDLVIPILFLIVACILSMLYVGGYWGEEKEVADLSIRSETPTPELHWHWVRWLR